MKTLLRGLALSLFATVVLTGCIKIDASFVLHEDDTIDGTMLIAVQKGIGDSMGMSDEDLLSQMTEGSTPEDLDGATAEPYEDEDWVGQQITFSGQSLADVSEDDAGIGIVRDGDFFIVQGDPLADETGDDSVDLGGFPGAEATMSVTFPGEVVETNGTVEGTTVTWDMFGMDEPMYAKGRASTGFVLPTWAWYAAGGALLLASGGIVAGVLISRRRSAPTTDAGAFVAAPAETAWPSATESYAPQAFEPAPADEQNRWAPPQQGPNPPAV